MKKERREGRRRLLALLAGMCAGIALAAVFAAQYQSRAQFAVLGEVCRRIVEARPDAEAVVLAAVKSEAQSRTAGRAGAEFLRAYGYGPGSFSNGGALRWMGAAGMAGSALLLAGARYAGARKYRAGIEALTAYLERVNAGEVGVLVQGRETAFSRLQDELYKTVTALHQTRDAATEAKARFAANLANIAHQLKTPLTAISLSVQLWEQDHGAPYAQQIRQQLDRLLYLEEKLLVLSRIDAGTLPLEKRTVDLYTAVMLAADQLDELFAQAGVSADIPEMEGLEFQGDPEWTREAVMNLLKNCLEHSPPGGCVHCAGEQNPLYAGLRIWDEGPGFAREDLPRLFERFYCGREAKGGTGLGLAFARELIELQNGSLTARNLPGGGACFELRLYRH